MTAIRTLEASEIDVRVGQTGSSNGKQWCSLLLYKDARCDMNILDEVYGPTNWKREHEIINGNLFCTVSVYDTSKKEWVSKQDVGTESNTEKVKGEASDSFKRACVNFGIGRELYTAPRVFVWLDSSDFNSGGKIKTSFKVSKITYSSSKEITELEIVDNSGTIRFPEQKDEPKQDAKADNKQSNTNSDTGPKDLSTSDVPKNILKLIDKAKDLKELENVWNGYPAYQRNQKFIRAINTKKKDYATA
nr:MAG TPA: Rad52/22 family double-strand break repair protein [Caudoviricetes sp.]